MKRSLVDLGAVLAVLVVMAPSAHAAEPPTSCLADYAEAVTHASMRSPVRFEEPETVIVDPSAVTDATTYLVDATTDYVTCIVRGF